MVGHPQPGALGSQPGGAPFLPSPAPPKIDTTPAAPAAEGQPTPILDPPSLSSEELKAAIKKRNEDRKAHFLLVSSQTQEMQPIREMLVFA